MTFLFDIGKVLLDFNFESSLRQLFPSGTKPTEINARLARLLDRKDEFEGGRISVEDYLPWALGILGDQVQPERFVHAWRHIFTPNLPMWRCVEQLHSEGHRLILLSNTNAIHCPWIFEEYRVFRKFHAGILSFEVGAIKPDPAIYRHAIEVHNIQPSQTRYIDDLPANIATGLELGFRCHQYDLGDHSAFEHWLTDELTRS